MKEKIIKNYLYSLVYQVLTVLIPLVTTPYISRILTSDEIGIYDYSLTICTYFMFAASAGIPTLAQRDVVLYGRKQSECFSYYYLLRLILTSIVWIVYCTVVVLWFEDKWIFIIQGIGLLASGFDISWYYAGRENFKIITNRNILFKIASLFLLFAFVKGQNALFFYTLSITLPNLIGNFLLFWKLDVKIIWTRVPLRRIIATLKDSITLLIPSLVLQLYSIIDKTILGSFSTMGELGYYAQTFKVVNLLVLASSTFGTVLFPQMVRLYHESKKKMCDLTSKSVDIIVHVFLLPAFGIAACADVFSKWFYGSNYSGINQLLVISMPIAIFKALSYLTANQAMIASNREEDLIKVICGGTLLNCILDMLLVKPFGAMGAIYATAFSEVLIFIVSIILFKNKIGYIKLINIDNVRAVIAAIAEYIGIVLIKRCLVIENAFMKTFLLGMVGVVIYISLLKFQGDTYYLNARKTCLNYVKRGQKK